MSAPEKFALKILHGHYIPFSLDGRDKTGETLVVEGVTARIEAEHVPQSSVPVRRHTAALACVRARQGSAAPPCVRICVVHCHIAEARRGADSSR